MSFYCLFFEECVYIYKMATMQLAQKCIVSVNDYGKILYDDYVHKYLVVMKEALMLLISS